MTPDTQHIFFDLDNTLWDFNANSRETLYELYEQFELSRITAVESGHFVDRYLYHNERFWDLYRQNRITKARLRKVRFEVTLDEIGITDKELVIQIREAYMSRCPLKTKLIEGTIEVLDTLRDHYKLHILSNGFQDAQITKLTQSGILSYFSEIVTSERASAKKPHKGIFEFALRAVGAQASQCLMIGDSLEIDVVGAVDNGWGAIHYNPSRMEHTHHSVVELKELIGLLKK